MQSREHILVLFLEKMDLRSLMLAPHLVSLVQRFSNIHFILFCISISILAIATIWTQLQIFARLSQSVAVRLAQPLQMVSYHCGVVSCLKKILYVVKEFFAEPFFNFSNSLKN